MDDPQKEVCGPFARLQSVNEQSSPSSGDSDNKAVSFIRQVIISQAGHTHTHMQRVKDTGRTEHSSVKLHVILIAITSAHESTRLTSQHDQLLISSCDSALLLLPCKLFDCVSNESVFCAATTFFLSHLTPLHHFTINICEWVLCLL